MVSPPSFSHWSNYSLRVQGEGNAVHPPVLESLFELEPCITDSLASRLDVVHTDAGMSEALRFVVAIVHLEIRVVLGAIVMRHLDDALTIGPVRITGRRIGTIVGEEVEIELVVWEGELVHLAHAEVLVEGKGLFGILDSDPGLCQCLPLV